MRILVIFCLIASFTRAQSDSAGTIPLLGINFGGQFPSGDMSNRFGPNLSLGGSFLVKTKHNWLLGLEADYLFGRNVKEDVLAELKNTEGFVVDNDGYPADLRVTQRGLTLQLVFGKVFNFIGTNANSGLMVHVGLGYMQHRIHLYDAQQRIAAIDGELRYGYDRLTNGVCLSQFIGYLHVSKNKLLNFYMGFTGYQAFTNSVRKLNYDTGLADTDPRVDLLTGFKLGWILPLYKKKPNDYYDY